LPLTRRAAAGTRCDLLNRLGAGSDQAVTI